jgi:hypothetical protein
MKRVLPIIYLLLIPSALFGETQGSFFSGVETQMGLGAGATVDVGLSAAKSKVIPPSTSRSLHKVIYAARYGVVCDGVTVNSTTVTNAIAAGGLKAHVIFPRGTCLVSVEGGTFNVYDGSWYSGAGKLETILKRANGGSANNNIFTIASGGGFGSTGNVLFTDMTIDGNYANQTGGQDTIGATTSPLRKFRALRMRIINSWTYGIGFRSTAASQSDILIADSIFETNGLRSACAALPCFDIVTQASQQVVITRNRSIGSQGFAAFSGHNGAGNVTVSDNTVTGCLGFAVALGGGGTNPGPSSISNNTFTCPGSNQNIVDLALWSDNRVENNTITFGSVNGSGIADGPPSNKDQIIGNHIFGAVGNQGYCIGPGGSDFLIADNFCTGAGAGGIGVNSGGSGSKGTVIENNVVKNSGQLTAHGGIELNNSGGTMTGVIIKGNKTYDDQGTPTQTYGIATVGAVTGYSNVTIEGNDVRGNKLGGINWTATPTTGVVIANNPGGEAFYVCQRTSCPQRRPPAPQRKRRSHRCGDLTSPIRRNTPHG